MNHVGMVPLGSLVGVEWFWPRSVSAERLFKSMCGQCGVGGRPCKVVEEEPVKSKEDRNIVQYQSVKDLCRMLTMCR